MAPKYIRHIGQVKSLLKDYEEEIIKVEKMLETEDDLRTRALLQEGLVENKEALRNLEKFIEENPNIFK